MPRALTVATRRSALALAQARAFVDAFVAVHPSLRVTELPLVTSGDRIVDRPLYEAGGKGLFVKEIEEALLECRADFAVHSMKDLPARQPDGLVIACVPERADPRDVLVVRPGLAASLLDLPDRARVGTSSLRRRIGLHRHRPDLVIEPLRGNLDTRLRKVHEGEYDAIVVAAAGLARLRLDPETMPKHIELDTTLMLPAVGQGALAIEARADDSSMIALLAPLVHRASHICAWAERGVLKALDADCTVPLAAHAAIAGEQIDLRAWLAEPDGSRFRLREDLAPLLDARSAEAFGMRVGGDLRAI
jgi:hydroxymethylbilane synthase